MGDAKSLHRHQKYIISGLHALGLITLILGVLELVAGFLLATSRNGHAATSSDLHEAPTGRSGFNRRVNLPTVPAAIDVEPSEILAVVPTSGLAGTLSTLVTGRGLLLSAVGGAP